MVRDLIRLLRPHQWTKNVLCLAGAVFAGKQLLSEERLPQALLLDLAVFGIFCIASSATYIFNDIADRKRDRRHPKKRLRPIPSGAVPLSVATALAIVLAVGALAGAWALGLSTLLCMALYVGNSLAFSKVFKHVVLVDVLSIAFGFVLRLLAGIYVLKVPATSWIVLCTFFLALFLGFAKRRAELHGSPNEATPQRPVLSRYSVGYLDMLVNSAATMAIMSYALFIVAEEPHRALVVTIPTVYYAIMHYKRLVMIQELGEEPEKILLKEGRIPLCILLWVLIYVAVEYWDLRLFL